MESSHGGRHTSSCMKHSEVPDKHESTPILVSKRESRVEGQLRGVKLRRLGRCECVSLSLPLRVWRRAPQSGTKLAARRAEIK
jgi:hypothetical protein